ncbi:MAG: SDR family oxidoreductase [Planctomycetota bacterium]|nr:SDR family oxidoreductase [Planctomycetota bacterium]
MPAMKTALVTGASSGIGAACILALAEKGFRVCLTARRKERLEDVCRQVNQRHGADWAIHYAGDVTDETVRRGTLEMALARWGRVDVLVNNAGTAMAGAVEEVNLDLVRQQFELNVLAYLGWMQLVGPVMRAQRGGRIINMSSISGRLSFPCAGVYAASKFAVEALSDAARIEYKPWNVHVVLVEPGSVVTEIWEQSLNLARSAVQNSQSSPFRRLYEAQEAYARELASGKGPSADLVAKVVCRAATARRPRARYCVPWDARAISLLAHLPPRVRDWLIQRAMGL